jgi:hypothetical protein
MITELLGQPEDIIQRNQNCKYCIFEKILPKEYRTLKGLNKEINEHHVHRRIIEEICGENYDGVCYMKYAAMRSMYDDFMASQLGAIKDFVWDLGKRKHMEVDYEEGMKEWAKERNMGFGETESYAKRFREIWNLGLRRNGSNKEKQNLTTDLIYEMVVAKTEVYDIHIASLKLLKQGHLERDAI